MSLFLFYSEYPETLDLFFSKTISLLRSKDFIVDIICTFRTKLFQQSIQKSPCFATGSSLLVRFFTSSSVLFQCTKNNPRAIHIYVLPIHIVIAPFLFLLFRHSYVVVSQGQLEGEGLLVSSIYRFFLSFSVRFSRSSFSCNIFETFRWNFWPFRYLSRFLIPLPWQGLAISRHSDQPLELVRPSSLSQKRVRFGYLGRICFAKGCHELLNYFNSLTDLDYTLELVGPVEPDFTSCLLHKPNPRILIKPSILPSDVFKWLHGIDIFITLSHGESIGASTLEALSAGKPVISRINSGSCQILRHCVDSFIIPDSNFASLDFAIDYVLQHYNSMSQAATHSVVFNHHSDTFLADHLSCFSSR